MEETKNLTEGKVFGSLIGFAVPILLSLLLQALYGAVDLLVVGRFATTEDVSGVSTGSNVLQMVTNVVTGLTMGITILVGEKIGQKKPEEAGRAIGSGICLFAVCGVILSVLLLAGANSIAGWLNAPTEAVSQTVSYIRICGGGAIFVVAYNVLSAIFRGVGDSRTPFITVLIACFINVAGDLFFVIVCDMGAAGAALATVMAQAISVIVSIFIIRKRKLPFVMTRKDIRFDGRIIGKELKLGAPVGLQDFLVSISFLVVQAIVNDFGVIASAGVGIAEKVCAFIMLVPSAFMQTMSAFTAQNMGAGKERRANEALRTAALTAFFVGLVMSYLSFFQGDTLSGIFSKESDVVAQAHSYLKAYGIDCVLTPFLFCFVGYFNGREKTLFVMLQGLIGAFGVRIPLVYLISRISGATLFHIGLATPASSVVQIILCVVMFVVVNRKKREVISPDV